MTRKPRAPFFVVNPKAYLYGKQSLDLALYADKLAAEYDIDIIFTVQHADAYRVSQATNNLFVCAQHMDGIVSGRGMGHILPESLVEAGIAATFLNHAEHPQTLEELVKAIKRAREVGILTIACANSIAEAQSIALLGPDIMVCEPTELIGTGKVSDVSYMKSTNQAVKDINSDVMVLQAAGISTVADVLQALNSGAEATGGTSGIVAADNPKKILTEMIQAVAQWKKENKS
ncbi:triosephosphate isomerase [Enterococcus sp. PF1-24]|uniref:triose-phosphate isomerase n=1 Tax=unclassified Enterococcus TaxID=2608891 RepID=UPI0024738AE4|nr:MULTISPECIES: triose-phosphate isomerase [unclassified Enterococcus]MDH6364240.1 triosephosphate isomerase [Enterococcus sp. PFB1-1]MDH6401401.1 triosephosphate isomerase [Enterococcus sp. PF1-24]